MKPKKDYLIVYGFGDNDFAEALRGIGRMVLDAMGHYHGDKFPALLHDPAFWRLAGACSDMLYQWGGSGLDYGAVVPLFDADAEAWLSVGRTNCDTLVLDFRGHEPMFYIV